MSKLHEKNLLKKVNKGDEEAFHKIYNIYFDRIHRFVLFKINSAEKVDEIVQDVFLRFWKAASDSNREITNISGLLYKIARYRVIDYYKSREYSRDEVSIDQVVISEELIVEQDLDKNIDIEYDLELVKEALPKLPQVYQDIILMRFVEEKTNREIAVILNKTENNINVTVFRALKALKKILIDKQNERSIN